MNFKEYYNLTKETTKSVLKIAGVIFTSIFAIIAIITGYENYSLVDLLEIFAISFILGNGFGIFIWLLAITSTYSQVKSLTKFYDSIPVGFREKFGLELIGIPHNPKYDFLQMRILDTKSDVPIFLSLDKKSVLITIGNDLRYFKNFQKEVLEIKKKYKKEGVTLTGWGLRKIVKRNDWNIITQDKFEEILNELKLISFKENLEVINRKMNKTGYNNNGL